MEKSPRRHSIEQLVVLERRRLLFAHLLATRFGGNRSAMGKAVGKAPQQIGNNAAPPDDKRHKGIGEQLALEYERALGLAEMSLVNPVVLPTREMEAQANDYATELQLNPPTGPGPQSVAKILKAPPRGQRSRVFTLAASAAGSSRGDPRQHYADVMTDDKEAYLLRVEDAAMSPRYFMGEYVLVEPGSTVNPEDDVVVVMPSGEHLLRRLLSTRGGLRLGTWDGAPPVTMPEHPDLAVHRVAHAVPAERVKKAQPPAPQ